MLKMRICFSNLSRCKRGVTSREWVIRSIAFQTCLNYHTKAAEPNKYNVDEVNEVNEWLDKLSVDSFPKHVYIQQFSRSSGPGGQNVNKLNTKCTLMLQKLSENPGHWMPNILLDQLLHGNVKNNYKNTLINNIYSQGKDTLIVQSDRTRSREMNKTDCLGKIIDLFKESFFVEKETSSKDKKKWEAITRSTNNQRLIGKKFNKDKKISRKKISLDC